jgi:glyoxylase-like metal-dependent hydrolase (beta-lactamase superfamily II)
MQNIIMRIIQLNVGGFDNNYSYIIIGENNKAILIDPTGNKKIIEKTIAEKNLTIVVQLLTHSHPDHCELANYFLKKGIKIKKFEDLFKEKEFEIAGIKIKVLFTLGHTKDSVCFLIENNLFTGDTLFVKGIGTTAYGGNEKELEKTLNYLHTLPQELIIWPGHNYGGNTSSLKEALSFSHKKPSDKVLEEIKKKVKEYEKDF